MINVKTHFIHHEFHENLIQAKIKNCNFTKPFNIEGIKDTNAQTGNMAFNVYVGLGTRLHQVSPK